MPTEDNVFGNENGQSSGMENQFDQLLKEVQEPTTEAPQYPEKIGELNLSDFESLLEEASGGSIKQYGELKEALSAKDKYAELQGKLQELEQRSKLYEGGPQYANPLVQKLDEFYKNGVPDNQIEEFLAVQKMDVDNLGDVDVVKMLMKREYPALTSEDLDRLIEDQYGDLEDIGGIKLKKDALDGRKKLAELKVNLSEPEHLRVQAASRKQAEERFNNWNRLTTTLYGKKETHEFNVDVGDEKHSVNFPIPNEFRGLLAAELARYATTNEIPPTRDGLNALNDFAERSILFRYGKEIMATLFRDAAAKTKEGVLSKVHNIELTRSGDGGQKKETQKKLSAWEEQKRKMLKQDMRM